MRELRNTKIIAVDHGYGNMKTANTVTPTGIKAYETEPIFTGNILEYNGIYYRIGEGGNKYEYNPNLMHLYVVGGGGCLIRNFGTYDKSRVTITMIDDICATAKGYESLAYMSHNFSELIEMSKYKAK